MGNHLWAATITCGSFHDLTVTISLVGYNHLWANIYSKKYIPKELINSKSIYSKNIYIQKTYIFKKYIYSKNINIQKTYIFKKYIYSNNIYIQKIYTFKKYIHSKKIYIQKIYIFKKYIYSRNIYIQKKYIQKYIYSKINTGKYRVLQRCPRCPITNALCFIWHPPKFDPSTFLTP